MEHEIELEEWLSDSGWLRRLAAQLVGEGGADDLVQETWLAALRRPPRSLEEPRRWLARVARNLAATTRRGTRRREARERDRHAEAEVPTPDELARAAEAQRLVAGAVARLAPPLRAAVVLCYYRGLDSGTAAQQLGIPPSTLRTRLQRALEELRGELDRERGRESWLMLLTPLVRDEGAVVAAGMPGALAMAGVVGTVCALSVGALVYVAWPQEARESVTPAKSPTVASVAAPKLDARLIVEEPEDGREALPVEEPTPAPAVDPSMARLAGTFRVDGRTLEWPLELMLETTAPARSSQSFVLPAKARGEFSFTLPLDWQGRLWVDGFTFLDGTLECFFEAPVEDLALHLTGKPQIVGRVVEPDGQPAGNVEIAYEITNDLSSSSSTAITLEDGRFRIKLGPNDERRRLSLVVPDDRRGWLYFETAPFDLRAGLDLGDLVLEPVRARGLTVRTSNGTALSGACARIEVERPWIGCMGATDAAGQCTLFLPERPCTVRLSAFGHADQVLTVSPTDDLEFELTRVALLALSIDAPEADVLSLRAEHAAFVWDAADGPDWEYQKRAGAAAWNERIPASNGEPWRYRYELDGPVLHLVGLVPEQAFELELFDAVGRSLAVQETRLSPGERASFTLGSSPDDGR